MLAQAGWAGFTPERFPAIRRLSVAITDIDRAAAEDAASVYGFARVADDNRQLLNSPDIDAVLICSSTNTHADLIVAAARRASTSSVKSRSTTSWRIDGALAAVENAGVKLQLGFNRRFDPNFARVRQAIVSGEIGSRTCCTSSAAIRRRHQSPMSKFPAACFWT